MLGNNNRPQEDPLYIDYAGHDPQVFDLDYCKKFFDEQCSKQIELPSKKVLYQAEDYLNMEFGKDLKWFLLNYGAIGTSGFETYGLSDRFGMESALIQRTLDMRFISKNLEHYVVFAMPNDGYAYCCNALDRVFLYSMWDDRLAPVYMPLIPYIVEEGMNAQKLLAEIIAHENDENYEFKYWDDEDDDDED